MKSACSIQTDKAGAPGQGAEIVTRAAKVRNTNASASEAADLVTVERGQPVTTTERIAAAAGLQHKNVLALVREHLADFREFGEVAFQTRLNPQGSPTEYAELNEPQAALLFLYQRNTAKVSAFKLRMVKDFARVTAELARARAATSAPLPAIPMTYPDALRALADTLERGQRVELALTAAETKIADQAPAVAAHARLAKSAGEMCLTDAAKSLRVGPKAFVGRLVSLGWIYRRDLGDGRTGPWRARQPQIDAGWMTHRVATYSGRDGTDRTVDQAMVTPRGLAKLAESLGGGT